MATLKPPHNGVINHRTGRSTFQGIAASANSGPELATRTSEISLQRSS